jgi:hypothetical protein
MCVRVCSSARQNSSSVATRSASLRHLINELYYHCAGAAMLCVLTEKGVV